MVPLLALGACSEQQDSVGESSVDAAASYDATAAEAESVADAVSKVSGDNNSPIPDLAEMQISLPKLAYIYDFSWRLPGEDIGKLQRRHADLCEQQGPASCQILGMNKSGEDADEVTGELQLAVATRHARAFGALLEKEATDSGADQISANIAAEDVSKAMVDTEARLQARTALRDRLQEVLRTRKGSVEELVEAERGVAQVNEEIDQARSWLTEMKGRVAYSRVNIHYDSGAQVTNDFLAPIQGVVGSLGSILGVIFAGLLLIGAIVLPIGGLVWGGRAISRRFGASRKIVTEG
ncbi:MAG: DUF4349 domain-containing protein [Pontixanthobacter sp.]